MACSRCGLGSDGTVLKLANMATAMATPVDPITKDSSLPGWVLPVLLGGAAILIFWGAFKKR